VIRENHDHSSFNIGQGSPGHATLRLA
jgi:hypothetical protein